jgi:hypothetical protein
MRIRSHTILMIIVFAFYAIQANAQDYADTVIVEAPVEYNEEGYEGSGTTTTTDHRYERSYMDEYKLEALRRKKEFQYLDKDSMAAAADSAFLKSKPVSETEDRFKGFDANILVWLVVAIIVIVIILQLAGVNMRQLFSPGKLVHAKDDGGVLPENIHEIPYESAIRQAVLAGNFSLATRLMYLQSLKLLSDKNLILWHENKTNWQYVYELKNEKLRNSFRNITHIFEYVQYGHMPINEEKFVIVQHSFKDFKMHVI